MKKAQIKSFETIAVLIVFFFLLVFGVIFYSKIQMNSYDNQKRAGNQLNSINIAMKMADLPELDCVETGIKRQTCIDLLKVDNLAKILGNPALAPDIKQAYFSVFGYSIVNITRIKLDDDGSIASKQTMTLFNNPNPKTGFYKFNMPVKILDPVTKLWDFGIIEVIVYDYE